VEGGGLTVPLALVFSLTVAPPAGAGSPSVTVPLTFVPPTTLALSTVSVSGGDTFRVAVALLRPNVAVRFALTWPVTTEVAMGNVAEVLLNKTVALSGGRTTLLARVR